MEGEISAALRNARVFLDSPLARVAVEELVQHDEVAEVRVEVELRHAAVACAAACVVLREDGDQAVLQLLGDVAGDAVSANALHKHTAGGSPKVHEVAAARRALDLEVLAVVLVEALKRLDHAVDAV